MSSAAVTAAADLTALSQAEFVHTLKLAAVPVATQQRAMHLMLDAIGCALAARQEDFALKLAQAIGSLSDVDEAGSRGVIGFARRLPLRDAVWLNGVLTHGLDYDDTHMAGVLHLSVSVLPAVLGLAARRGASGADLLTAYIAGLECGARVASVVKGGLHAQGFHPTGVVGAFACAVAAGKLLGLSAPQLVAAQTEAFMAGECAVEEVAVVAAAGGGVGGPVAVLDREPRRRAGGAGERELEHGNRREDRARRPSALRARGQREGGEGRAQVAGARDGGRRAAARGEEERDQDSEHGARHGRRSLAATGEARLVGERPGARTC